MPNVLAHSRLRDPQGLTAADKTLPHGSRLEGLELALFIGKTD